MKNIFWIVLCVAILAFSVNTQSSRRPEINWQVIYFDKNYNQQNEIIVDAGNATQAIGIFENEHRDVTIIIGVFRSGLVSCQPN